MSELINEIRGWQKYISHCAEHDLEMTGSDYDETAAKLGKAADALEQAKGKIDCSIAIEKGAVRALSTAAERITELEMALTESAYNKRTDNE